MEDRYLGDGVYASFDGHHIVLDLRGQDNYTRIALEPAVMSALMHYDVECMNEQAAAEIKQATDENEEAELDD